MDRLREICSVWTALSALLFAFTAGADLTDADRVLAEAEALLETAHFHTALGVLSSGREWLEAAAPCADCPARAARLEVLTATAEVALGETVRARASMRRALEATPELELDEEATSPKLVRLWREVRPELTRIRPGDG